MGSCNRPAIKLLLDKTVYFPLLNWVAKIHFAGSGRGGGGCDDTTIALIVGPSLNWAEPICLGRSLLREEAKQNDKNYKTCEGLTTKDR